MKPELSIIIPVFERASELTICLSGLRSHLDGIRAEVTVIDDASPTDGAKQAAFNHGARYIRLKRRRGSAYCKNVGIDQSSAGILLFLDSDIEFLASTSLPAMINLLSETPRCGQVGGEALLDPSGQLTHIFGRNIDSRTGRSRCDYFEVDFYSSPVRYDYVPTSNCMVKRADAVRVNGFDDFYPVLGEDKDFGYRLALLGLHSYVTPYSVVLHHFARTGRRGNQLDKQYRTQVRFCLRHYGLGTVARELFRQQMQPYASTETNSCTTQRGKPIEAFEARFAREILRIKLGEGPSTVGTLTRLRQMARAVAWNLFHARGLRQQGSGLLSLTSETKTYPECRRY